MDELEFDIDKSVKRGWLVVVCRTVNGYLDCFFRNFSFVFLSAICITPGILIWYWAFNSAFPLFPLVVFSPVWIFSLLAIPGFLTANKLFRIGGIDEQTNRQLIIEVLDLNMRQYARNDFRVLRINKKGSGFRSFHKRTIIIFNGPNIFTTISNISDRNTKSPLYFLFDFRKILSIKSAVARKIEQVQALPPN